MNDVIKQYLTIFRGNALYGKIMKNKMASNISITINEAI